MVSRLTSLVLLIIGFVLPLNPCFGSDPASRSNLLSRRRFSSESRFTDESLALRRAWYRFEFLSLLASHGVCQWHDEIRQQSRDAWRLATGDSTAPQAEEQELIWKSLVNRLCGSLPTATLIWTDQGPHLENDSPVPLVEGLENLLLIRIDNRTLGSLRLTPSLADSGRLLEQPWEVTSGAEHLFLLPVRRTQSPLVVNWKNDDTKVSVEIPVRLLQPATLRIITRDPELSKETPARLQVRGSDGWHRFGGPFVATTVYQEKPELQIGTPRTSRVPYFYSNGICEVRVPPGSTTIIAERGLEHSRLEQRVELKENEVQEIEFNLQKFFDASKLGWISGDTHVHWVTEAWNIDLPLEELVLVQRAEDLRVINNLTLLHRTERDAFIKPSQAAMGPIARWSTDGYHLQMAEEYRNQNLFGHLCLLNLHRLVLPIGTGPQIAGDDSLDYPINRTAILDAIDQGGIVIEAHGMGADHEIVVNAIHGLNHSLDQIEANDYYDLLNCGFQLPLTNGSDHPARPIGAARAFVHVDLPFSYEKWIDGIRRARTFTTSGPLLFLEVEGSLPGDVIVPQRVGKLQIQVHAVSRTALGHVQIISNDEILAETHTDECKAHLSIDVSTEQSRWVVARCSQNGRWNPIWDSNVAHTSAVYVHVEGRPVFRDDAAQRWIEQIKRHRRNIQTQGRFANDSQRDEALAFVDEAIHRLERRRQVASQQWQITDTIESHRERAVALASALGVQGHELDWINSIRAAQTFVELDEQLKDFTSLRVQINPEARVKMQVGAPPTQLVPYRTYRTLVRVDNEAGIRAPLRIQAWDRSLPGNQPMQCFHLRWVENGESTSGLSGARTEWKLLEFRCDAAQPIEVHLTVDAGQGTQDLGFRAEVDLLFEMTSPR